MKIYIDFDGTLFDTDKYTKDFINILSEYGINNDIYEEAKMNIFNDRKLFNVNVIVDYFIDKYNIYIELKDRVDNLLNNSYVYPEIVDCIQKLINNGYEPHLLTYGDYNFQKMKIKKSNIAQYFKEIIITEKDKSKLDIDYENSIFIDNNPVEVEKFYNSMAKTIIRIRRESDRYSKKDCNIPSIIECEDFNQVIHVLKGGVNNE